MRVSNSSGPLFMVAPNGARRGKDANPNTPLTSLEIVEETIACAMAGADALHLHVRDASGKHTLDAGQYRETLQEIERALPGFPVQITTEAAGIFDVQQQVDCLREVKPKAASISVREMARDTKLASVAYWHCQDMGTQVQHILYDQTDWHQLQAWCDTGVVHPGQDDVLVVLGRYSPAQNAMVEQLYQWRPLLDQATGRVMVCAFGRNEHQVLCAAAALGADLRIGFENSIHDTTGRLATSNAAQVACLVSDLSAPQKQAAQR